MQARHSSALFTATAKPETTENIDKTMEDVDSDPDTFDPTAGDHPAVSRNNEDGVWVQQVSLPMLPPQTMFWFS